MNSILPPPKIPCPKDGRSGRNHPRGGSVLTPRDFLEGFIQKRCAKISFVIITKNEPYTKFEIGKLLELLDVYIKTVIDVKKKVCSAGCNRHFESEKVLLDQGSKQPDIWGGGIDLGTKAIDCNSFINIR